MSVAYDASRWGNFFLGEVGASAALIGLLFVATSINLERILAYPSLPGRAAETLALLVNVLLVATFGLIPEQTSRALGWEVLATSTAIWLGVFVSQIRARRFYERDEASRLRLRVLLTQAATLPFLIGGISLIAGSGGGLYWLVAAMIVAVVVALENSWVLLVEILR